MALQTIFGITLHLTRQLVCNISDTNEHKRRSKPVSSRELLGLPCAYGIADDPGKA